MMARAAAGLLVSLLIALAARRAHMLSRSGVLAAAVIGTAAIAAGWRWGALLVAYFVVASLLSRLLGGVNSARVRRIVAKDGPRDAWQVMANGGMFALCALGTLLPHGAASFALAALGALAASSSDTWATEIGTRFGGTPLSLRRLRAAPAGTSGAVSIVGSIGMLGGAAFVAGAARALDLHWALVPIFLGGVAGAVTDTVVGALGQEKRWCNRCNESTERAVHPCGAAPRLRSGMPGVDNDAVNMLASFVGAAVAVAMAGL